VNDSARLCNNRLRMLRRVSMALEKVAASGVTAAGWAQTGSRKLGAVEGGLVGAATGAMGTQK